MIMNGKNHLKNETLIINGQNYEYKPPINVKNLLSYLGFNVKVIVIDYNGSVLQKELWTKTFLKNMDTIEILTIAGGG